ncbi:cation/proton antiporter [Bacillus sp. TS-2]|nr:cation/proton antiporter [Bacillus sp. TS-2]
MISHLIMVDAKNVLAVGLLIAYVSSLIPLFFGDELFTHYFNYFELPILGTTQLTTTTIFLK